MVTRSLFTYTGNEGEKTFKITVYEVVDDPVVKYVIKVNKNGKEVSAKHTTLDSVINQIKLYGTDVYEAFINKVKDRLESSDVSETSVPESQADVILSLAINSYYSKMDIKAAPVPGDIVEDVYSKRLGVVEYVEYVGANHFPIYQVRWEDGTRSTRVSMQLRVVVPREDATINDIDFERIKEDLLSGDIKPLDGYTNFRRKKDDER